jgi:hypothetical protein
LSVGGNSDIAGVATVNKISERVAAVASVSNVVGVDYTASAALYYVTGSVTGNLVCNITNVPTSATYRTYTVSVVIPAKYCVSSATVNGAAVTLLTNGGILNNNISNATLVIQQISVMMTSVAATPTHVVSSIGAYY